MQVVGGLIITTWCLVVASLFFLLLRAAMGGSLRNWKADEVCRLETEGEEYPSLGPTGQVTMLFTDIQSSTCLWEADEEVMAQCLALHDDVMRHTLKDHGGFEVLLDGPPFCACPVSQRQGGFGGQQFLVRSRPLSPTGAVGWPAAAFGGPTTAVGWLTHQWVPRAERALLPRCGRGATFGYIWGALPVINATIKRPPRKNKFYTEASENYWHS